MQRSFDGGVGHFEEEAGVRVRVPDEARNRVLARLHGFHIPSLIKFHRQILGLVASGASEREVADWFAANQYRIELAISGILWSAGEAGYAAAASADGNLPIWWNLDNSIDHHCGVCPIFEDGSPYTGFIGLPAWPGDGTTPCGGNCYCYLSVGHPAPDA